MTGTIDVSPFQAPHGLQVDANGTLYVTCDTSRKFLVIDPKTRTVTAAIDTEGTGHWIAVLPDGSKAYVANKNDRPFVSVIDIKARKMTGKIDMPNGTQGITVSPDGKRVLAADGAHGGQNALWDRLQRGFEDRAGFKSRRRDDFGDRSAQRQGSEHL